MAKKVFSCIACFVFIGAVFFAGYYVGNRRGQVAIGEFEKRLNDVTNLNKQLQDDNSRLRALTDDLAGRLDTVEKRLGRAKDIIDGFSKQIDADGDTIQRAIDTVSKLEQLLSVIGETK